MVLVWVATIVPVLAYWAGAELFVDRFAYRWWHFAIALAIAGGGLLGQVYNAAGVARGVLVVLVYVHLVYVAITTSADDLVEGRRRFRRWFLTTMALLGVSIGVIELFDLDRNMPSFMHPAQAGIFLALTLVFVIWALEVNDRGWTLHSIPAATAVAPAKTSPADGAVLMRLNRAMDEGVWRTESLTVGELARKLNTPEHRLRKVINQSLGHRNFAAFINGRRIAAAMEALSDPSAGDVPIITIAYDVGFASLGPFNRAFRDISGEIPTDFRKRRIGAPPADSE